MAEVEEKVGGVRTEWSGRASGRSRGIRACVIHQVADRVLGDNHGREETLCLLILSSGRDWKNGGGVAVLNGTTKGPRMKGDYDAVRVCMMRVPSVSTAGSRRSNYLCATEQSASIPNCAVPLASDSFSAQTVWQHVHYFFFPDPVLAMMYYITTGIDYPLPHQLTLPYAVITCRNFWHVLRYDDVKFHHPLADQKLVQIEECERKFLKNR
jgi:hypothetical protein